MADKKNEIEWGSNPHKRALSHTKEDFYLEDGTKKMDELNQKNSLFDTHTPLLFGTH